MLSKPSIYDIGVPSPTVKMTFPLVLTLVGVYMEEHSHPASDSQATDGAAFLGSTPPHQLHKSCHILKNPLL